MIAEIETPAPGPDTRAPCKRMTLHEERLLRRLQAEKKSTAEMAAALRALRPWANEQTIGNWRRRRGLTGGRVRGRRRAPAAEPQPTTPAREHEVTIRARGLDPVAFRVTRATAKAVLELLVGL